MFAVMCSPTLKMDVIGLNQCFIRDLIEAYKSQPALWKMNAPEYKNKVMKVRGYEAIVRKCREYVNGADREFVKTKINSLRTCFRKEYRKVLNSKKTATQPDEIYKPHLWYYDLLTFLKEDSADNNGEDSGLSQTRGAESFEDDDDFEDSQDITVCIAHSLFK